MSKIGRKPIDINGVQVEIADNIVSFKGAKNSGQHRVPKELVVEAKDKVLVVRPSERASNARDINRIWGLHRALLSNKIRGAVKEFEKQLIITGLGYKATLSGKKLVLSLGYVHKIEYPLPDGVTVDIDAKTGQKLTFKSSDRELAGKTAAEVRAFKVPEPYKQTGIKFANEVVFTKAGKTSKS